MSNINELWTQVLEVLEPELTQISYDTWIKPIKPIKITKDEFVLCVPNEFHKEILIGRHIPLLKNAVKQVSLKEYEISIQLESDLNTNESHIDVENEHKVTNDKIDNGLNSKYTFSKFVVGNNNRFAHAAGLAISESPGIAYNPLYIYGGVGLGKTHLMQAIGNQILENNKSLRVLYVTSEKFTNELISAIQNDRINEKSVDFREKYRNIDVLLIDDIQFLAGKERTQEEFFHTFNSLYELNKQIVLTSDKPPKYIAKLEERLKSRFEWGLICDIQPPDFETRNAILRKKVEIEKLNIPNEVLSFIAENVSSNVRELEGSLNKVIMYANLSHSEININLAKNALKDVLLKTSRIVDNNLIIEVVAKHFNVREDELVSKKRNREVAYPRQVAMYLCREIVGSALTKIGEDFGGRDHSTVIHACDKIASELKENSELVGIIDDIKKDVEGK